MFDQNKYQTTKNRVYTSRDQVIYEKFNGGIENLMLLTKVLPSELNLSEELKAAFGSLLPQDNDEILSSINLIGQHSYTEENGHFNILADILNLKRLFTFLLHTPKVDLTDTIRITKKEQQILAVNLSKTEFTLRLLIGYIFNALMQVENHLIEFISDRTTLDGKQSIGNQNVNEFLYVQYDHFKELLDALENMFKSESPKWQSTHNQKLAILSLKYLNNTLDFHLLSKTDPISQDGYILFTPSEINRHNGDEILRKSVIYNYNQFKGEMVIDKIFNLHIYLEAIFKFLYVNNQSKAFRKEKLIDPKYKSKSPKQIKIEVDKFKANLREEWDNSMLAKFQDDFQSPEALYHAYTSDPKENVGFYEAALSHYLDDFDTLDSLLNTNTEYIKDYFIATGYSSNSEQYQDLCAILKIPYNGK